MTFYVYSQFKKFEFPKFYFLYNILIALNENKKKANL